MKSELGLIRELIERNYNLGTIRDIVKNKIGFGKSYEVQTNCCKLFVKVFSKCNTNVNLNQEIKICSLLNLKGIKCSEFLINRNGEYLTRYDENNIFHIQKYINGDKWNRNTSPIWLLEQGINNLARINNELCKLNIETTEKFKNIDSVEESIKKIGEIQAYEKTFYHPEFFELLMYKKYLLTDRKKIDMRKLTIINSHGDYNVSQLITKNSEIIATTDFSETSCIPACYEILKYYTHSSIKCAYGFFDKEEFKYILKIYERITPLNKYDLSSMIDVYIILQSKSLNAFSEYLIYNNTKFYIFEKKRMKILKYFYENRNYLTDFIMHS